MTIVKYTGEVTPEAARTLLTKMRNSTKDEVVCVPKDWDVLEDCSLMDLVMIRNRLDNFIARKAYELEKQEKQADEDQTR